MSAVDFAGWAIDALLASCVLMGVVMLVRAPVRRTFGAQIGYALWALPPLRLVLPPLPPSWRTLVAAPISHAGETVAVLIMSPARTLSNATPPASSLLALGLALVWAAGATVFLVWHIVRHARFCRRMLGSANTVQQIAGIRVIASPAAAGPLAFGILRRYVAFPCDFAERYDADERALALAHELTHHARGGARARRWRLTRR